MRAAPAEHFIGADIEQGRIVLLAGQRDGLGAKAVDVEGFVRVFGAVIDSSQRRTVDHQFRLDTRQSWPNCTLSVISTVSISTPVTV